MAIEMTYKNLTLWDDLGLIEKKKPKAAAGAALKERGCDYCPLNKIPGLHKVKGLDRIQGKRIMIWAQNPGQQENAERLELVGRAGQFLWENAAKVGLKREDCDIQNSVRCWTVDVSEAGQLTPREPSKQELHCCSLYSEEALRIADGRTKVHLVLGKVAARALLRSEFRVGQKTFWSERLQAHVITTFHPSYFLRGAPRSKIKEFKNALASAVQYAGMPSGKFAYIQSMDYKEVAVDEIEQELYRPILDAAAEGERIVIDIEDGYDEQGNNVTVYVGFSWKKGHARGLLFQHYEENFNKAVWQKKVAFLKRILENKDIRKVFHYGAYDVPKLFDLLDIRVQGYDHDTAYSEYLRNSDAKAYGLEAIADVRFREFAGYKGILDPYKDVKTGDINFWQLPRKILTTYNGADCDLTKRIEKSNSVVPHDLLQVFISAAIPLARMERNGPFYDATYAETLKQWLPTRIAWLQKRMKAIARDENFNPNAPKQASIVIYEKLKLGRHLPMDWLLENGTSTGKDTLEQLLSFHDFPVHLLEYRKLAKKKGTYADAFEHSAELNGGRIRTKWWITGTTTGRLRSGGERGKEEGKKKGIVNLQNIDGSPEIENLIVSDTRWGDIYQQWLRQRH